METILIATDFSAAAQNATRYGFELAETMQAKVILFNCYHEFAPYSAGEKLQQISNTQLAEAVEIYNSRRTVEVETQSYQGKATDAIIKVAVERKVALIVLAMKEDGKEVRKIFGSTVTSLIAHSTIPFIVVPEQARASVPKKIVLASDLNNENNIDIVRPLKRLVEISGSKLTVVRVIDEYVTEPVEMLMRCSKPDWFLKSINPDYEFLQESNAGKAIIDFVEKNAVDMLAVISHQHNLYERLFTGGMAKYFSYNTNVPLLILPSVIVNKTKTSKEAFDFCSGRCLEDNNGVPQCDKYSRMKHEYDSEINT